MISMDPNLDSKHGDSPSLHISGAILGPTQSSCKFLVKCALVEQATAPSIPFVTKIAHLRKPVCQILRVGLLTSEHLPTPFGFRFLRLPAVWTRPKYVICVAECFKHTTSRHDSDPIPLIELDESALLGTVRLAGWLLLGMAGRSRYGCAWRWMTTVFGRGLILRSHGVGGLNRLGFLVAQTGGVTRSYFNQFLIVLSDLLGPNDVWRDRKDDFGLRALLGFLAK